MVNSIKIGKSIRYLISRLKNWLYKPGREWLCGLVATIYFIVVKRKFVHVFFDNGVWVHKDSRGSIVDLHVNDQLSLTIYERNAIDYWTQVYKPKPGNIVIDVGAGKGEDTYYFSKSVGPNGRVLSIEAHPQTYLCLEKFCQYNQLINVTPINVAVCEKEEEVIIDNPGDNPGADIFSTIVNSASGFKVQGLTLDAIVKKAGIERIDFLKMNIEGAEKMVIRGMAESIKKIKYICISCHDFLADQSNHEAMRTKKEVTKFLEENNFRIIFRESDKRLYIRDQVNGVNISLI